MKKISWQWRSSSTVTSAVAGGPNAHRAERGVEKNDSYNNDIFIIKCKVLIIRQVIFIALNFLYKQIKK